MRRLPVVLCVLAFAACNGGGTAPPPSPAAGIRAPETLYVAGEAAIQVFPAAGGPVLRNITGIGAYDTNAGQACNGLCYYTKIVATAAPADGTLVTLVEVYQHPRSYADSFLVFDRNANGPTTAGAPEQQSSPGFPSADPQIAVVAGSRKFALMNFSSEVDVFSLDVAHATPFPGFTTPYTNLRGALAVDQSGSFYISDQNANLVAVFAANAPRIPPAAAAPVRTLSTGAFPTKLTVGSDGTVYVVVNAVSGGGRMIQEFAAGASTPSRTLGPFFNNGMQLDVADLALDRENELFIALNGQFDPPVQGSVWVFAPGATDATAPIRRIDVPLGPVVGRLSTAIRSIAIGP